MHFLTIEDNEGDLLLITEALKENKKNNKRRTVSLEPTNEPAKHPSSSNKFQNSN